MKSIISALFFIFCSGISQAKPIEIIFWHSFAGDLSVELNQLVKGFNHEQSSYRIKPVYKGEYTESLTSFATAFRAGQAPAMIQTFEVGTSSMRYPPGIIKPVGQLIAEQGANLSTEDFLPALRDFYSHNNQLLAFPLNTSIPVIYYNADALKALGYTGSQFPQTWDEMEILASKLRKQGFACAYTSAYPAWIQIESYQAVQGLEMINRKTGRLNINTPLQRAHLERLQRWQKKHYFEYGGRASNATVLFTSGRCPLYSQSSGSYNGLAKQVHFKLGVASLPHEEGRIRHNNVVGGAALWVVSGQSNQTYKGIVSFLSYLARPEIQKQWHLQTGYLPLGTQGKYQALSNLSHHPVLFLAQRDLGQVEAIDNSSFGAQNLIRTINDEALESIFSGIKNPQEALAEAEQRGNYALLRFKRNTGLN